MLRRLSADQKRSVAHWIMEFVIVVAGVMLALWLQQWDQRRRARAEMQAAEESIHDEIREALKSLIWRKAISKCHQDRIELLQAGLLRSSRIGQAWWTTLFSRTSVIFLEASLGAFTTARSTRSQTP